jgi:hypothetical protein
MILAGFGRKVLDRNKFCHSPNRRLVQTLCLHKVPAATKKRRCCQFRA